MQLSDLQQNRARAMGSSMLGSLLELALVCYVVVIVVNTIVFVLTINNNYYYLTYTHEHTHTHTSHTKQTNKHTTANLHNIH